MRIRQIALAATDLAAARRDIEAAFAPGEPFQDPGVETFGLNNWVFPAGDTFLEVVSPVERDTSAGRYLDKRGGDGGYMVIVQAPDLATVRARLEELGVRVVFEVAFDDIATIHLHPKDTGGVLLSIDWADPPASWRWAGPGWQERASTDRIAGIEGVDIDCERPDEIASKWSAILAAPLSEEDVPALRLDGGGVIRFTRCEPGRPEGIRSVRLACNDVDAIANAAGGTFDGPGNGRVTVVGTQFELRPA